MSQNALYLILSFSFGSFWVQQNSFIQMPSSSSHTTTKFVISMHIRFSSTLYLEHYSTTLKAFLSIVLTILGIFSLSTFSDRLRDEKVSCEKSRVRSNCYYDMTCIIHNIFVFGLKEHKELCSGELYILFYCNLDYWPNDYASPIFFLQNRLVHT